MPFPKLILRAGVITVVIACAYQGVSLQLITGADDSIGAALRGWHSLGWVGLLLAQVIIAACGVLPASLIGVSAGATYGAALGFTMSAISLLLGAIAAFLLSRSLFRPLIERRLQTKPHLSNFDHQIQKQGWRLVCLLRLSPVMPFAATSYALGLSSIAFSEYVAGTLASLPSLLGYVLVGVFLNAGVSSWIDGANFIRLVSFTIGALATALLAVRAGKMLRRVLRTSGATDLSLCDQAAIVKCL